MMFAPSLRAAGGSEEASGSMKTACPLTDKSQHDRLTQLLFPLSNLLLNLTAHIMPCLHTCQLQSEHTGPPPLSTNIIPGQGHCAHLDGSQGPGPALEGQLQGQGHIQDDLLVSGLGILLGLDDVLAAHVANVASNIQESKGGDLHSGMKKDMSGKCSMVQSRGSIQQSVTSKPPQRGSLVSKKAC
eukprot:979417-Pelagomonas_calceolata.AAC.2